MLHFLYEITFIKCTVIYEKIFIIYKLYYQNQVVVFIWFTTIFLLQLLVNKPKIIIQKANRIHQNLTFCYKTYHLNSNSGSELSEYFKRTS